MTHPTRVTLGLAAALAAVPLMLAAALPPPDKIPAAGGDISIQPINHATLQIVHASHVITIDPVAAAGTFAGLAAPTLILVTDIHGDHLDPATVARLKTPATKIVAPAQAAARLEGAVVMANGETKTIDGVTIEAVPMYNLTRGPSPGQLFHDRWLVAARGDRGTAEIYLAFGQGFTRWALEVLGSDWMADAQ